MLDKRTGALLNALNALCENGAYKILSMEEILEKMPLKTAADAAEIRSGLHALCEREYIRVKYEDEREVCLCTLPKGRFFYESMEDKKEESVKVRKKYFFHAFFGALIGGMLAALAAAGIFYFF